VPITAGQSQDPTIQILLAQRDILTRDGNGASAEANAITAALNALGYQ
jgi:hypothetical protein